MAKLFDKVSGSFDSFDSNGITDSNASFKVDQFKHWFVAIAGNKYTITSNTATTLSFNNSLSATGNYEIAFVGRDYLNEIESDFSDVVKINDDLISKKYNQTNIDLSNTVFAFLRPLFNGEFDPTQNILNLSVMQQTFAYYMIYLIFKDLSLNTENQNYFKSEDHLTLFKSTIKDVLALLQVDFDEDGKASSEEKRNSASSFSLVR